MVVRLDVSSWRYGCHVDLVVNGTATNQQLPVCRPGGHVEGTGVVEHHTAFLLVQIGHLGESDVVANANANLAVLLNEE